MERHLTGLSELAGEYEVVVNCAGLGAGRLCGDPSVVPIRGQVRRVRAPWVRTALYAEPDTYIIPGHDWVTVGGTRQYGDWKEGTLSRLVLQR